MIFPSLGAIGGGSGSSDDMKWIPFQDKFSYFGKRMKNMLWDNYHRERRGEDYLTWNELQEQKGMTETRLKNKEVPTIRTIDETADLMQNETIMYLGIILIIAMIMK